jgi:hypothetical protein
MMTAPMLTFGQNVISQLIEDIGGLPKEAIMFNISGKMLKMAMESDPSAAKEDRELIAFLSNVKKLSFVMGFNANADSRKKLNNLLKPFEELLTVVENEMNISMLTLEKDGETVEFIMKIDAGEMLVLLDITGKIDLEQLSKLSEGVDINGQGYLDNLDKLKNRKKK